MLFRLQNIDSMGLIWRIFRNKDLRLSNPHRDIYLTPPGPRCSVFRHERGLSADLAGTGTTLQQGGGLRGVPGLSALAPGMGMSARRRTGGVVGATCPLALWPVPIR